MNHSTDDDSGFSETFEFYVEGVILMIVAIIGITGNIIFILIFSCHAKKINTFHSLMVCMAYFDTIYLTSSLFIFAVPLLWPPISRTFLFTHSITLLLPTAHIGINGDKIHFEKIQLRNNFLCQDQFYWPSVWHWKDM